MYPEGFTIGRQYARKRRTILAALIAAASALLIAHLVLRTRVTTGAADSTARPEIFSDKRSAEHLWILDAGEHQIGLIQWSPNSYKRRSTLIILGPIRIELPFRAAWVLAGSSVIVAFVAWCLTLSVLNRPRNGQRSSMQSLSSTNQGTLS
jgi:hypothetical protein